MTGDETASTTRAQKKKTKAVKGKKPLVRKHPNQKH